MVKSKKILSMMGVFLIIVFTPEVFSQNVSEYHGLKKYRKWGIIIGPTLYNRATLEPQYGDYTFENKPMLGFNAGFEYDFYPDRKWSFITGLIVAMEPAYKIVYSLNEEDLYPWHKLKKSERVYGDNKFIQH